MAKTTKPKAPAAKPAAPVPAPAPVVPVLATKWNPDAVTVNRKGEQQRGREEVDHAAQARAIPAPRPLSLGSHFTTVTLECSQSQSGTAFQYRVLRGGERVEPEVLFDSGVIPRRSNSVNRRRAQKRLSDALRGKLGVPSSVVIAGAGK